MFITTDDYKVVTDQRTLAVITQQDADNRANAEEEAIEEMASYLRPKYDTRAIFDAQGSDRNRLLVMFAADIALYHLSACLPQKMGTEVREQRYKRAIEWLQGVQRGQIVPDLPLATDDEGTPATGAFLLDSQPKLRHNW